MLSFFTTFENCFITNRLHVMSKIMKELFGKKFRTLRQIIVMLLCIGIVVYIMPRDGVFNYQYSENTPWGYGQIMAGFNFPVYKGSEQIEKEKDSIRTHFMPYFTKDTTIAANAIGKMRDRYYAQFSDTIPHSTYIKYRNRLRNLYDRGIISSEELEMMQPSNAKDVRLITNNIAVTEKLSNFVKVPEAYKILTYGDTTPADILNEFRIDEFIIPNISYDSAFSGTTLQQELEALSESDGIVQKGQKIISRGEIVDAKTFQILRSYHMELDKRQNEEKKTYIMLLGQSIFVLLCFGILYIYTRHEEESGRQNKFLLVMLSATIFPVIVGVMMSMKIGNVFMLPIAIVPMLLSLFTRNSTAFITHSINIILCSIMLNSPYEFVLMQIPAGLVAILCMRELSSRSQMFSCAMFVLLTYCATFFSYELIMENDISKMNVTMYIYFAINAILLLLAYPIMFVIEKLFGFISNVTLIEISNINSEPLRKLSQDAPGTFQHSMQVGNLAADAARSIGANSLEVRTGALFHDIGKTLDPIYFTENQSGGKSPHDGLSPEESAKIIIKHVTDGIALAKKHHLPRVIREFITTHHGLSKAGYFYITYKNNHPNEEIDESIFTYPGPNPFTREQAILMLADCVEAASHSLKEYTEEDIDNLVENIVNGRVKSGELNNSPLTFQNIETIKKSFKERLKAIYHTRISYPTEKKK